MFQSPGKTAGKKRKVRTSTINCSTYCGPETKRVKTNPIEVLIKGKLRSPWTHDSLQRAAENSGKHVSFVTCTNKNKMKSLRLDYVVCDTPEKFAIPSHIRVISAEEFVALLKLKDIDDATSSSDTSIGSIDPVADTHSASNTSADTKNLVSKADLSRVGDDEKNAGVLSSSHTEPSVPGGNKSVVADTFSTHQRTRNCRQNFITCITNLKTKYGESLKLKKYQLEACTWLYNRFCCPRNSAVAIVKSVDDLYVSAKTGDGKTLIVDFLSSLSAESGKITLVVSPLVALMQEQSKMSLTTIQSTYLGGTETAFKGQVYEALRDYADGKSISLPNLLFCSPESLVAPSGEIKELGSLIFDELPKSNSLQSIVFDEGHLILQWGKTFRSSYLKCFQRSALTKVPRVIMSATLSKFDRKALERISDSVNSRVAFDVMGDMSKKSNVTVEIIDKASNKNKSYSNLCDYVKAQYDRMKHATTRLPRMIIFARYTEECKSISKYLNERFVNTEAAYLKTLPYYGSMEEKEKETNFNEFATGDTPILISTTAMSHGVHVKDVRHIVHYFLPQSLSEYQQKVFTLFIFKSVVLSDIFDSIIRDTQHCKTTSTCFSISISFDQPCTHIFGCFLLSPISLHDSP